MKLFTSCVSFSKLRLFGLSTNYQQIVSQKNNVIRTCVNMYTCIHCSDLRYRTTPWWKTFERRKNGTNGLVVTRGLMMLIHPPMDSLCKWIRKADSKKKSKRINGEWSDGQIGCPFDLPFPWWIFLSLLVCAFNRTKHPQNKTWINERHFILPQPIKA